MKIKRVLLAAILVLPLLAGGTAFAQMHEGDGDQPVSSQTTATTDTPAARAERIKARKSKVTERLTLLKQNQVKLACRAASVKIKAAHAHIDNFGTKRAKVYSGLVTRLEGLSPKLKAAGVDTKQYDEQVAALKIKTTHFQSSFTGLKQVAKDIEAMDCTADPEGFMATLKEAREARMIAVKEGQEIRDYLRYIQGHICRDQNPATS